MCSFLNKYLVGYLLSTFAPFSANAVICHLQTSKQLSTKHSILFLPNGQVYWSSWRSCFFSLKDMMKGLWISVNSQYSIHLLFGYQSGNLYIKNLDHNFYIRVCSVPGRGVFGLALNNNWQYDRWEAGEGSTCHNNCVSCWLVYVQYLPVYSRLPIARVKVNKEAAS